MRRIHRAPVTVLLAIAFFSLTGIASAQYRFITDVTPASVNAGDLVTVRVLLEVQIGAPGGVDGSSFGMCHNPADYALVSANAGLDLSPLPPCGSPPDFLQILPLAGGFSFGTVHSFSSSCSLGPGCYEIATATYTSLAAQDTANDFCFCTIATPPVAPLVAVGTATFTPQTICGPPSALSCTVSSGVITLNWTNNGDYSSLDLICDGVLVATLPPGTTSSSLPVPPGTTSVCCQLVSSTCGVVHSSELCCVSVTQEFIRCDCNADGVANIADIVCIVNHLFFSGSVPCLDATDGNDDGIVNIADAISCLLTLFSSGSTPSPSPGCGPDPTADAIGCASFPPCP